jgi:MFS family permease
MDEDVRTGALALLVGTIHFPFHLFMRLVPPLVPVLAVTLSVPLWELLVGSSVGLLPMGVLSDSYDRRATLSVALAVVGAGYLLFGLGPSLGTALPTLEVAGHAVSGPYLGTACSLFVATLFSDRVFRTPDTGS